MFPTTRIIRIAVAVSALSPAAFGFQSLASPTSFVRSAAVTRPIPTSLAMSDCERYSIPDQPARFARAKAEHNQRYLDITTVYDPSYLKGKRVAVTGANRGIGFALAKELKDQGAKVVAVNRSSSPEMEALELEEVVLGVDVTDDDLCSSLPSKITGGPIDIVSDKRWMRRSFETTYLDT